jgi:O-antigen ligase
VSCYFVGLLALGRTKDWRWFAAPFLISFLWILRVGIGQHFGGLAETKAFMESYYGANQLPAEFVKRMSGGRVFSTLFYPNAFAGALLLLLPLSLGSVWEFSRRLQVTSRILITGIVAVAGLACLAWSGSKAGWLLMLMMAVLIGWKVPISKHWKIGILIVLVAGGLTGFAVRYATFFQRGATSVVARFDYWSCAGRLFLRHPVFGTGPGTFSPNYAQIKRPEAEMARLVHNDYLQQASDSGVIGFLAYLTWIATVARRSLGCIQQSSLFERVIALGLIGWIFQGVVEFGLYVPALAWPGFLLSGMLVGRQVNAVDNLKPSR